MLDCRHVVCLSCADQLGHGGEVKCPLCRQVTYVDAGTDIPNSAEIIEKLTTTETRCHDCTNRLGICHCTHCDQEFCAQCLEEHMPNNVTQLLVSTIKALYKLCYYIVRITYWIIDRLLQWISRIFSKIGLVLVSLVYGYVAFVLVVELRQYLNNRVPKACVLPWGYDRVFWYGTQFDLPWEVAVSVQGHVIVSDLRRNSVTDLRGDFQYDLVTDSNVGRGLAVDNQGNTFVSVGRDIHVFRTNNGKQKMRITLQGNFDAVRGLAVHNDYVYACAGNGFNIVKTDGTHVMRYNLPTTPQFMDIAPNDDIVISDTAGSVVIYRQKLPDMNQLHQKKKIQSVWLGSGFSRPGGLVVDCDGNIIVADTTYGRLVKYNKDGKFVSYIKESKNLKKPQGLALSLEGDIIVCDHGAGLVVRYSSRCRYNSLTRLFGIPWCSLMPV